METPVRNAGGSAVNSVCESPQNNFLSNDRIDILEFENRMLKRRVDEQDEFIEKMLKLLFKTN